VDCRRREKRKARYEGRERKRLPKNKHQTPLNGEKRKEPTKEEILERESRTPLLSWGRAVSLSILNEAVAAEQKEGANSYERGKEGQ